MKSILITDSLFIFPEHEQKLKDAGFFIERLDKPEATEDELITALKGKSGYILGGIEKVTDTVIENSENLEVISFTGSDWRNFIPGIDSVNKRGIAITNCPGANSNAVSEYTISLLLAMTREIFDLGRTGIKTFQTTKSLAGSTIGIIGMGHIGEKVVRMLKTFRVKEIFYFSRTRKENLEQELGIKYVSIDELLKNSDIISLHASKEIGDYYFNKDYLTKMKNGSLLVNCSFENAINFDDLYPELESGRISCAHDGEVKDERFKNLPIKNWFNSNAHTAYNTYEANKLASDMATESIINIINTGNDKYKVN